jgi:choline-glycine betaine transporter
MEINLFTGTTPAIKAGFWAFVIAAIGVSLVFLGAHTALRALAISGFGITVFGVAVGFVAVCYGLVRDSGRAISGSAEAVKTLHLKIKKRLSGLR